MPEEPSATVVVMTALNLEYKAVRDQLHDLERDKPIAGTLFEIGRLPGMSGRVALALTGPGNSSAAVLAERAITRFRPRALMFVGIAGALKDDVGLGDVIVATKVYGYHGGKEQTGGFRARPEAWLPSHELIQVANYVYSSRVWPTKIHFKPIAAGEVVLNSRDRPVARRLQLHYQDAAAVEMESAGFAHAGHLNASSALLTVRGISDRADGAKSDADQAGWQERAAANAATFALAVAADLLASVSPSVAAASGAIRWRPLSTEVNVHWRSDLIDNRFGVERPALELHLVPEDPAVVRLEVRRLASLAEELASLGRSRRIFTSSEQLVVGSDDRAAWAMASNGGVTGPAGIAVSRTGQRSVWQPLPHDMLGSVLDPDDVTQRIVEQIGVLAALAISVPTYVAPAVAVQPRASLAEGRLSDMPRTSASLGMSQDPVRVLVDEALPYADLISYKAEVAEELVARLMNVLRQSR